MAQMGLKWMLEEVVGLQMTRKSELGLSEINIFVEGLIKKGKI